MLTLLDRARAANAVARNQANSDALRLVAGLRRVFGLDDGDMFSDDLVQFVAELQRSAGLGVDGVIGPKTMKMLDRLAGCDVACHALWPAPDAAVDQHEHFASLLGVAGFAPSGPRPTLVALRGVWLNGRLVHPVWHAPLYDDAFVLLQEGAPPFLFRGATHPYQIDSKASADLDGDGRKDVGMVRPGRYVLEAVGSNPPIFKILTLDGRGEIPVYRDTSHDARIDDQEKAAAETATRGEKVARGVGAFATEILLHPGYDTIQSENRTPFSSIGCQTAPEDALKKVLVAGKMLDFLLIDAADLAPTLAKPTNVA